MDLGNDQLNCNRYFHNIGIYSVQRKIVLNFGFGHESLCFQSGQSDQSRINTEQYHGAE